MFKNHYNKLADCVQVDKLSDYLVSKGVINDEKVTKLTTPSYGTSEILTRVYMSPPNGNFSSISQSVSFHAATWPMVPQ